MVGHEPSPALTKVELFGMRLYVPGVINKETG
jgi:hypothetical protein